MPSSRTVRRTLEVLLPEPAPRRYHAREALHGHRDGQPDEETEPWQVRPDGSCARTQREVALHGEEEQDARCGGEVVLLGQSARDVHGGQWCLHVCPLLSLYNSRLPLMWQGFLRRRPRHRHSTARKSCLKRSFIESVPGLFCVPLTVCHYYLSGIACVLDAGGGNIGLPANLNDYVLLYVPQLPCCLVPRTSPLLNGSSPCL